MKGKKTGGRQRGTVNAVTVEAKAAASALVDDEVYRAKLLADLRKRKVAPAVECLLWHYAKGKPKDRIEHSVDRKLEDILAESRQ